MLAEKYEVEWITEEEMEKLMIAFVKGRGEEGVTEEEFVELIRYASGERCGAKLIDMAIAGQLVITGKDENGEYLFTTPDHKSLKARDMIQRHYADDQS